MKNALFSILMISISSQAMATGIRCVDGYAYYDKASDRPNIIIHSLSPDHNTIRITGAGFYKIKGKGTYHSEKNGTPTLIADQLIDSKGNRARLKININGPRSATVLETANQTISRNFFCTDFSWKDSEFDR